MEPQEFKKKKQTKTNSLLRTANTGNSIKIPQDEGKSMHLNTFEELTSHTYQHMSILKKQLKTIKQATRCTYITPPVDSII